MVDAIGTPWCWCGGLESSDGRVWCRCGRVGDGSRVREGRVQWRPLGLQVPQVARTPSWYGMVQVLGGVEVVYGAGERAGEVFAGRI